MSFAGSISTSRECHDVVWGSLVLHGAGQSDQARKLLALISSKDNFIEALTEIIRTHFGDPTWEPSEPLF